MNKRFTQLKSLTKQEWQVLLSSLLLLPLIAMALRIRGFKWTRKILQNRIPHPPDSTNDSEPLSTDTNDKLTTSLCVARMVSVAANHGPYRANCLKRSLATWWLLQRRGIAAELNIGVNKDSNNFKAHAWVEYMGNTLIKADDITEQYSTFGPQ
jgi:hypothetical protein